MLFIVSSGGLAVEGRPQRAEDDGRPSADQFTGDLSIRHQRVRADGAPAGPSAPAIVLRVDRRRVQGVWRTVVSVRDSGPIRVQSLTGPQVLDNPFALARLEYDEDGTPPRLYNRAGRLVTGPTEADRRFFAIPAGRRPDWDPAPILAALAAGPAAAHGRGPADGLVVDAGDRARRRGDLERRFGPPVGLVRGFDRFVHETPTTVSEVLLRPDTALPVEVNLAREGRLVSRVTFDYQPAAASRWVRRHLRSEQSLNPNTSERLVTDIELIDVTEGRAR